MRLAVVILGGLFAACPVPPSDTGPTSPSDAGGSSSGRVWDAGPRPDQIELGALCRTLRDGYRNALLRTLNRCGAAYTHDDLERFDTRPFEFVEQQTLQQAQSQLPAVSCDQFASLRVYVDHVLQSVDRDRVRYDAIAAAKCQAGSSLPVLARRDRPPVESGAFALVGTALPDVCREVFHGLQQAGEPCDLTHECAAPLFCRPRADDTSVGTCKPPVPIDGACDSRDVCADDGFCENARCRPARADDEPCLDAQGYALACAPGMVCVGGRCQPYGDELSFCGPGRVPCAPGLVCAGEGTVSGARCRVPMAVGGACTQHAECADCARCNSDGRCEEWLAEGAPCTKDDDACAPGLHCADDQTCRMLPVEGETCRVDLVPGPSQHGNCRHVDNFCARTRDDDETGTCRRFPTEGEACGIAPDLSARCVGVNGPLYCNGEERGVCVRPARLGEACSPYGSPLPACDHGFCRREGDGGDVGVCTSRPNIGAPCGLTPDLSSYCQTGYCRRLMDAPDGVCTALPDIDGPCGTASHVSPSCVFGVCLMEEGEAEGVCGYPLPAGAPCTSSEACETRVCDPHVQRCITPGQSCQGCSRFEPILFILSLGMVLRVKRRDGSSAAGR